MTALNCGSGQRPFDRTQGWINLDIQPRWRPDIVADWNDLGMFKDNSVEFVVSHHSLEHVGCGEGDPFIKEAHRVLKPDGSLLIFVPDLRALAQRWLTRQIDDYTYIVNLMGAYMGDEHDRHKWHFTHETLRDTLSKNAVWSRIVSFNWRTIPGADLAHAWWVLAMDAVK